MTTAARLWKDLASKHCLAGQSWFFPTIVLDLYPYWKWGKIPCDNFYWYSVTASVITMGYYYQTASCCFIWLEDIRICPLLHHTLIPCLEKKSVSLLLSASFLARD